MGMTTRVRKQYTQHGFEFKEWEDLGALADLLADFRSKKWQFNGRAYTVETSPSGMQKLRESKYANSPDMPGFEQRWNLYRNARVEYEERTGDAR
jgi:hypothetical protein